MGPFQVWLAVGGFISVIAFAIGYLNWTYRHDDDDDDADDQWEWDHPKRDIGDRTDRLRRD